MKYSEFLKITIDELVDSEQIKLIEIPNIGLYMDQVTTFMDENLDYLKRSDKDKILTKTMINNYTKNDLMPKTSKKKYNKEHLVFLILIYGLKQNLSIKDINKLMHPILENHDSELEEKINILDLYNAFVETSTASKKNLKDNINEIIENAREHLYDSKLGDDELLEIFTLILTLISNANAQTYLAEKLIDEYFSPEPKTKPAKKNRKNASENQK